jgi:hypothetical protein
LSSDTSNRYHRLRVKIAKAACAFWLRTTARAFIYKVSHYVSLHVKNVAEKVELITVNDAVVFVTVDVIPEANAMLPVVCVVLTEILQLLVLRVAAIVIPDTIDAVAVIGEATIDTSETTV